MSHPDVLIVGAGVVGCSIARSLSSQGMDVVLLDRDRPGTGATWAAAGLLSPHLVGLTGEIRRAGLALCRRSFEGHAGLGEALKEESGIDVQPGSAGVLEVARSEAEVVLLREHLEARREAGLDAEWISGAEARQLEPGVSDEVLGGALHPREGQIDNRLLCRALARSARRSGTRVESGRRVYGLRFKGGRLRGVMVDGEFRQADRIVVAAGCGSAGLVPPGRGPLPIEPVRGQMLLLQGVPGALRRPILSEAGYLVPRRDGRVLAGSTLEPGVQEKDATLRGVMEISGMAASLAPILGGWRFVTAWAGLRPCTPDWLPILGPDPEHPELIWATGHGPNGMLLAPVTAEWVGSILMGEPPPLPPGPFAVQRFLGAGDSRPSPGTPCPPVA